MGWLGRPNRAVPEVVEAGTHRQPVAAAEVVGADSPPLAEPPGTEAGSRRARPRHWVAAGAAGYSSLDLVPRRVDLLVPVVLGLVRTLDRHTQVFGLRLGEFSEPHSERIQVQASNLFV